MTMELAYISEISRYLILIVLLFSAWTKTANIDEFTVSLADDFYVPIKFRRWMAFFVVSAEWVAFFLIFLDGLWSRAGFLLALLLFTVFSLVILETIIKSRKTFCSCFGRSRHPISSLDLLRNLVYIIGCIFYLLNANHDIPLGLMAQFSIVLIAALCFLISISMHEIKYLMQ